MTGQLTTLGVWLVVVVVIGAGAVLVRQYLDATLAPPARPPRLPRCSRVHREADRVAARARHRRRTGGRL